MARKNVKRKRRFSASSESAIERFEKEVNGNLEGEAAEDLKDRKRNENLKQEEIPERSRSCRSSVGKGWNVKFSDSVSPGKRFLQIDEPESEEESSLRPPEKHAQPAEEEKAVDINTTEDLHRTQHLNVDYWDAFWNLFQRVSAAIDVIPLPCYTQATVTAAIDKCFQLNPKDDYLTYSHRQHFGE